MTASMLYQDVNTGGWFRPVLDQRDAVKLIPQKRPLTILERKTGVVWYYDEDDEKWHPVEIKDLKNPRTVRDIAFNTPMYRMTYAD
jgi:hypothetical protein